MSRGKILADNISKNEQKLKSEAKPTSRTPATCGIIMPISPIDGCSADHWNDVLKILGSAINDAGFEPNLVSNSNEIGIIQNNIVNNLYDNPIVVCDVSCKNPNVMFELGMRLAFDMPTIIVKDDKTTYSFDTSPIEHLEYPRDLHFFQIKAFEENLSKKIRATIAKAKQDSSYSPFLKHFGKFRIAKIDDKEITSQEFVINTLNELDRKIEALYESYAPKHRYVEPHLGYNKSSENTITLTKVSVRAENKELAYEIARKISEYGIIGTKVSEFSDDVILDFFINRNHSGDVFDLLINELKIDPQNILLLG
jgi:hypothetical protein